MTSNAHGEHAAKREYRALPADAADFHASLTTLVADRVTVSNVGGKRVANVKSVQPRVRAAAAATGAAAAAAAGTHGAARTLFALPDGTLCDARGAEVAGATESEQAKAWRVTRGDAASAVGPARLRALQTATELVGAADSAEAAERERRWGAL